MDSLGRSRTRRRHAPIVAEIPASCQLIAVLDTGAISSFTETTTRGRSRLLALRLEAADIVVSTAVLAEGLLSGHVGRDHHISGLLTIVRISVVDASLGFAAGSLRRQATKTLTGPPPSGVDAIVAALADALAARDDVQIFTTDITDITALIAHARHRRRISISAV